MSVNVSLKNAENQLLALGQTAGCGGWAAQLQGAGCILSIKPKQLLVMRAGVTVAQASMNTGALPLLLEGKLSKFSADTLRSRLCDVYEQACKELAKAGALTYSAAAKEAIDLTLSDPADHPVQDEPVHGYDPAPKAPKKAASPADLMSFEDDLPPAAGAPPVTGAASLVSGAPVLLAQASKLHQPVKASSAGSVYHTIALGDGINLAARLKIAGASWKLSVRAEGAKLSAYKPNLHAADVDVKSDYASLHLSGDGGLQMAQRAIGALLYGTGIPFTQMSTNPQALVNQGH